MPRPKDAAFLLRAVITALVLAILATACAGDDAADQPSPAASPGNGEGSAEEPSATSASPTPGPTVSPRYAGVPARQREAVDGPIDPRAFTDPAVLAEQLLAAELAIRADDTSEDELVAWAWTQQQAYRDLVEHPEWRDSVKATLPGELHSAFDRNVHANVELRELTTPRESLPEWRIVAPPPADELLGYYRAAGEEFGIGWEYLASIHLSESRMGRIRGVSTAGARGPMQFLPSTWEAYGEGDIDDPHDAIRAAARYLVDHGAPQDMQSALYAYNHSQHYVNAVAAHAAVMREEPATYRAYYHWRVYYRMTDGEVILPEGWEAG